jgi:hypothetical protein
MFEWVDGRSLGNPLDAAVQFDADEWQEAIVKSGYRLGWVDPCRPRRGTARHGRRASPVVLVVLAASHLFAQSGATLVGAAYSFPGPVVAPGQIIQLQVAGLKTVLSPSIQKATSVPLPTVLAGISVTVNQLISQCEMCTPVQVPYTAPLVSLEQVNSCPTPDCLTTFIAIQIPYELHR